MIKNSFIYSLKRSVPILIGYFPVGIAFGLLMASAGYNFLWSMATSLFVFAGSLQMLMISFLGTDISLLTVIVTALLLNSRHIFYGISFIEKFKSYGLWKYFLIYGLTDESYSLLCSYKEEQTVDEKWVHIFSTALIWLYWVFFSGLGGLVGQFITVDTTGIDFALTALFIVIFIDQLKDTKNKTPGMIALLSSFVWIVVVGPSNFLLPSLVTTVLILVVGKEELSKEVHV